MVQGQVKQLLDQIESAYPKDRLSRAKEKYNALWDFATPFIAPPVCIHRGVIYDGWIHPAYHTEAEMEATLLSKLQMIVELADVDDDYIPVLTLDTGAYIIGNSFGAAPEYNDEKYLVRPIIDTPDQAAELPFFDPVGENFYMNKVFDMLRYMRDQTEGRIPINIHTPQGPLETLSTIWDANDFMVSLLTEPDAIVQCLGKVVEAQVWYIRKQMAILGDQAQFNFAMSYNHRPAGTGIGVGEDIISIISPDLFDLFAPTYRRLASEFGDLLIHSCGNPAHQIENIVAMPEITGLHFSQQEPEDYFEKITRPIVVHSKNDWRDFADLEHFVLEAGKHHIRYNLQFQSLEKFMQIGDDVKSVDPSAVQFLMEKVTKILNHTS